MGASNTFTLASTSYDSKSLDVSAVENFIQDIKVSPDGTKLYFTGTGTSQIHQYTMSTAGDITTATADSVTLTVSGTMTSFAFSEDGTKVYVLTVSGFDKIHQYELATAWDLATTTNPNIPYQLPDNADQGGVGISPNGARLYTLSTSNLTEYVLSTPYSIGTAGNLQYYSTSSDNAVNLTQGTFIGVDTFLGFDWNDNLVYHWNLATDYSITTASLVSSFDVSNEIASGGAAVCANADGSAIYVATAAGVIYQYSTGSALTDQPSEGGAGGSPPPSNVPTPTAHWSMDASTLISGEYQPTPDKTDDRLTVSGTVNSVAAFSSEGVEFDGNTSNYLTAVGTGSLNKIEEIDVLEHTLSAWVKVDSIGSYGIIISNNRYNNNSGDPSSSGSSIGVSDTGKFFADYIADGTESYTDSNGNSLNSYIVQVLGSTVVQVGVWYHVTGVFTQNSAKIYVNGVLDGSLSTTVNHTRNTSLTNSKFTIGAYTWNNGWFLPLDGVVDEVKVWDSTLTDSQVTELYQPYIPSGTYEEYVTSLSPIAWYKLDETSGTTASDSSGNGYNGIYNNNPTLGQNSLITSDTTGKSVLFNGTNQNVSEATANFRSGDTSGSISVWFNTSNTTQSNTIFSSYGTNQYGVQIFIASGGQIQLWQISNDGGNINGPGANPNVNNGETHHLVITSNGSEYEFYLDGVSVWSGGDGDWLGDTPNRTHFSLGSLVEYGAAAQFFDGTLDDIVLFDRPLTPLEVQNIYNKSVDTTNLTYSQYVNTLAPLAWYKLDETSGTTATDSANGYNGTYTNGPVLAQNSLIAAGVNSVNFDGSDDFVDVGNEANLLVTGDVALSCFIKPTSTSGLRTVISMGGAGELENANYLYRILLNEGVVNWFHEGVGSVNTSVDFTHTALVANNTYHLVVSRDDSAKTLSLYIDGSLADTKSYTDSAFNGSISELLIGCAGVVGATSLHFEGNIDEAQIYGSTLSATEVNTLYSKAIKGGGVTASPHYIGTALGNLGITVIHIKPSDIVSTVNLSSSWSG